MTSAKQKTLKAGAIVNVVCSAIYIFSAIVTLGTFASYIGLVDQTTGETITPEVVIAIFITLMPLIIWAIASFIISIILLSINKNLNKKNAVLALTICLLVLSCIALIFAIAYINIFVLLASIACLALYIIGLCLKYNTEQTATSESTVQNTEQNQNAEVIKQTQQPNENNEMNKQIQYVQKLYENNLINEEQMQNMIAKIITKNKKENNENSEDTQQMLQEIKARNKNQKSEE